MVGLVFFSTSNCGYCKPIRTMLENLKPDYDNVEFTYIVVDKDPDGMNIAREHKVNAVPTILIFAGAVEQERLVGDIDSEKIVNAIEGHL